MLDFCIKDKYVTFGIYKNIAREKILYLVCGILETSFGRGLLKTEGCHIGVNHYLGSRMSTCYSWLCDNGLNCTPVIGIQ